MHWSDQWAAYVSSSFFFGRSPMWVVRSSISQLYMALTYMPSHALFIGGRTDLLLWPHPGRAKVTMTSCLHHQRTWVDRDTSGSYKTPDGNPSGNVQKLSGLLLFKLDIHPLNYVTKDDSYPSFIRQPKSTYWNLVYPLRFSIRRRFGHGLS
jgi:hypothetical protein